MKTKQILSLLFIMAFLFSCNIVGDPPYRSLKIETLKADKNNCSFREQVTITLEAFDPAGEGMDYYWLCTEGSLSEKTAPTVIWQAHEREEEVTIMVIVTSKATGLSVSGTLTIEVKAQINDTEAITTTTDGDVTIQENLTVNGEISASNLTSGNLDYIYAGQQTLVDYYENAELNTAPVVLAAEYSNSLIGYPRIPNPDPEHYLLVYYLSAALNNSNGNYIRVSINGITLLKGSTWSTSTFKKPHYSAFWYSWEQFPPQPAYGYSQNGLNISISAPGPTRAQITDIAVNYVYVRKGVDYPKVSGLTY